MLESMNNTVKTKALEATMPHAKVSKNYKFVNTQEIVDKFIERGWQQTKYQEAYTRKYQGFQTHVVTLSPNDSSLEKVGDSVLRILITNNHHASKALRIQFGLYRLVCSNGLVISDAEFDAVSIRHMGATVDEQVDAFIEKIYVAAEKLREKIAQYKAKTLDLAEMRAFARKALETRFKPELITDTMIGAALYPNRLEDISNDAWTVFNRVQENIIRGFESADRDRRIRRITSVKKDMEINEKLWDILAKAA